MSDHSTPQVGRVYLVGAGPGDPGLITLRGIECLRIAQYVLYDYLVNPRILEHTQDSAECICVGRHGSGRLMSQTEINDLIIAAARSGKTTVRLKGGDPIVFGRLADEVNALNTARIPFEIVPGITTALAAGSHAGIPLTHRRVSSAVALLTAHEEDGKAISAIDYNALAAFPGTLVFYMGVVSAPQWTTELMAAGKPADTPAAIIRRCSWPDQLTIRCTLGTVVPELTTRELSPPVIVIVGEVASLECSIASLSCGGSFSAPNGPNPTISSREC